MNVQLNVFDDLPAHLRERTREIRPFDPSTVDREGFVLYWMRNALRSEENPALDVAVTIARIHNLSLLVYQGLSEHYAYSSDRHHTFILEGARDVQQQFSEAGISYAFHLSNRDDRRSHLVTLAGQATVVVTEEMPVDPARRFLEKTLDRTNVPVMCVDTACIVPMKMVKKAFTRAFKYREATKKLYRERIGLPWPEVQGSARPFDLDKLPFEPLNLQDCDIAELVAGCDIDHAVGPVVDTRGGSTAGYARWNEFKTGGIGQYAKTRNNALKDGVSRMSAYLHYGMVSPFRVAREAKQRGGAGAEKYLDELLIWRELAYAFCFHRDDHDQLSAIPVWAGETLERHRTDPREKIYSWEQLARAGTGNELWNAAQRSLLVNGELHNNVRMTWGKAICRWTRSAADALQMIIDLNHRYALDGRDPASYGGILWCLGQFDRPFEPEQPVIGSVRPRPLSQHASRLDPAAYGRKVSTTRVEQPPAVAVIGAGLSGTIAARTLSDHGLEVSVFEKSRGAGGRMSTRRTPAGLRFDHGAQYFTVRDERFRRYVDSWIEQGVVAAWPDRTLGDDQRIVVLRNGGVESESGPQGRFVGTPAMSSICKHIAGKLDIRFETRIETIEQVDGRIRLIDSAGSEQGIFDFVVLTAPAEQSASLLSPSFPLLAGQVASIEMNPCLATMVSFNRPVGCDWVGAFVHDSFLSWVARNSTKPGRVAGPENLVLHANNDWSRDNFDADPDWIATEMVNEFFRVAGLKPATAGYLVSHRWKYAIPPEPGNSGCLFDADAGIAVCGDWASGARVEGAFLSGMAAAGRLLGELRR